MSTNCTENTPKEISEDPSDWRVRAVQAGYIAKFLDCLENQQALDAQKIFSFFQEETLADDFFHWKSLRIVSKNGNVELFSLLKPVLHLVKNTDNIRDALADAVEYQHIPLAKEMIPFAHEDVLQEIFAWTATTKNNHGFDLFFPICSKSDARGNAFENACRANNKYAFDRLYPLTDVDHMYLMIKNSHPGNPEYLAMIDERRLIESTKNNLNNHLSGVFKEKPAIKQKSKI